VSRMVVSLKVYILRDQVKETKATPLAPCEQLIFDSQS
jgi:hypothetical protein